MNALLSNPFKRGLLRGETQIGLWLSSTSSYMAEIAATSGYDWQLLIDRRACPEHYSGPLSSAAGDCPYASQPVIRPVEGNRSLIKQVLDIGARTLLVPMVDYRRAGSGRWSQRPVIPHREPRRWRRRGESGALGKGGEFIWRRQMTNFVC
ncbi:aldolase/citrate lyase family protein [Klebsiella pneumoniae subsp. pneumoniae]|nr:aldolase/citrate lyase family protein [Klebsiella pneumoniae subsp. pneumoniae]